MSQGNRMFPRWVWIVAVIALVIAAFYWPMLAYPVYGSVVNEVVPEAEGGDLTRQYVDCTCNWNFVPEGKNAYLINFGRADTIGNDPERLFFLKHTPWYASSVSLSMCIRADMVEPVFGTTVPEYIDLTVGERVVARITAPALMMDIVQTGKAQAGGWASSIRGDAEYVCDVYCYYTGFRQIYNLMYIRKSTDHAVYIIYDYGYGRLPDASAKELLALLDDEQP